MRCSAAALGLCLLSALSGCARYAPRPLDHVSHSAEFRGRRLDDPALRRWIEERAGPLAGGRWSDAHLVLAALAYRADLERARRDLLAARAAVLAAGSRPAPGAEAGVERAVGGREESSPWVVSLTGLFPVELGGKRAARVQAARAREAAARAELSLVAAAVLDRVRRAALGVAHAEQVRAELALAMEALGRVEMLERSRYAEAALGSGDLARTATETAASRAQAAAVDREIALARADLAGALAVPAAAIRAMDIRTPSPTGCAWAAELGGDSVVTLTLSRRAEMARALAGYAEAEAEVRSRVAATRPDLEIGPGFIWDQGIHRWTLGVAVPALLGLRSRAPIAAAEAAREAAAARVTETQEAVLAQLEHASEECRSAGVQGAVADSQAAAAARVAELARAAYARGETGRLEVARAELLMARTASMQGIARRSLDSAALALELATAAWPAAAGVRWPDPERAFGPGEETR